MRIWSFVSEKGGSGKTTLTLQLSVAALSKKLAVSVLDLDPQRSAEQWADLREKNLSALEPTIVHGNPSDLEGMLEAARETNTDLVLIDTPPTVDRCMIFAAAAAHMVVIPTRSNVLDRFALKDTLTYMEHIGALWKSVVVLNAPSKDKKARAETEEIVAAFDVPLLSHVLEDHIDFAQSLGEGKGITERWPKRKAATTIRTIYRQLCEHERTLGRAKQRKSA